MALIFGFRQSSVIKINPLRPFNWLIEEIFIKLEANHVTNSRDSRYFWQATIRIHPLLESAEQYYMTNSSFHYTPGLLVWHSDNLIDWEPIGHAILEHVGGSIMAPDLIYHEGLLLYLFSSRRNQLGCNSRIPEGPWSKPIDSEGRLYRPGHAEDQEGNRFLFLSEGYMVSYQRMAYLP